MLTSMRPACHLTGVQSGHSSASSSLLLMVMTCGGGRTDARLTRGAAGFAAASMATRLPRVAATGGTAGRLYADSHSGVVSAGDDGAAGGVSAASEVGDGSSVRAGAGAVAGGRGCARSTENCQGGVHRQGVMGVMSAPVRAGLGLPGGAALALADSASLSPDESTVVASAAEAGPAAGSTGLAASESLPSDSMARCRRRGVCVAVHVSSGEPGLLSVSGCGLRHRSTAASSSASADGCKTSWRSRIEASTAASESDAAPSAHCTEARRRFATTAEPPALLLLPEIGCPDGCCTAKVRRRTAWHGAAAGVAGEAACASGGAVRGADSSSLSLRASLAAPRRTDLVNVRPPLPPLLALPSGDAVGCRRGAAAVLLPPGAAATCANPGLLASGQVTLSTSEPSAGCAAAPLPRCICDMYAARLSVPGEQARC